MSLRLTRRLGYLSAMRALACLLTLAILGACAGAPEPQAAAPTAPQPAAPTAPQPATSTLAPSPIPTLQPTAAATAVPAATAPPTATPAERYDLVLTGATLIDGTGAAPLPGAVVAIRAGAIAAVGPAGAVAYDPASPTRDLRGATLLPGFINVHAHTHTLSDDELRRWTRAGVTTVRDLGGPRDSMIARRQALASRADPALPRLLVAGPIVTVPGGHPIPIYGLTDEVLAVAGPDDARRQVGALIDAGVDVIKIAVSGRTDVRWPELSDAEIGAIAELARARGVRLAAHIDRASALRRAAEDGITDAAHMPRDRMPDDLIALMVARGVVLSPTIAVYEELAGERGAAAEWRRTTQLVMYDNLRRYAAAGGRLALGDDYGNPGVALGMPMAEIRHWLAAGLTPMQVIVAATQGGALACGLSGTLGVVRPGLAADLLAVAGDPLADIAALERVALVVHGGAVVRE